MSQDSEPNPYYNEPGDNPNAGGSPLMDEHIRHRQVSAQVPEHIGRGVFSTGVVVTQGPYEFVVDFLQNLTRPHQVAARVIVTPAVLGQWVNVLRDNLGKYERRFGKLPPLPGGPQTLSGQPEQAAQQGQAGSGQQAESDGERDPAGQAKAAPTEAAEQAQGEAARPDAPPQPAQDADAAAESAPANQPAGEDNTPLDDKLPNETPQAERPQEPQSPAEHAGVAGETGAAAPSPAEGQPQPHPATQVPQQRPSIQEVYDDLKLPDTVISGSYANAVMVGHSVGEFYFDFITNFFPRSAVSCRVFLSARQIPRLLDALTVSFQRYQQRLREAQQRARQQQQGQHPPMQAWPDPPKDPPEDQSSGFPPRNTEHLPWRRQITAARPGPRIDPRVTERFLWCLSA